MPAPATAIVALLWLTWTADLAPQHVSRLRTLDPASTGILQEALRRSSHIRELVAGIESADLLVYLLAVNEPGDWRGKTQLGSNRMLFVRINLGLRRIEQIAALGHELQHVIEVANAREVVDRAGLVRLFERIGFHLDGSHDLYETLDAQIMERRVRWQLSENRQRARRLSSRPLRCRGPVRPQRA